MDEFVTFKHGYYTTVSWSNLHSLELEQRCHLTSNDEDIVR